MVHKKLNAGALQYTMFIAVLIVIMIATFLTLTLLQNQFKTITNFSIQSVRNSAIGFDYVAINEIPYDQEQELELKWDVESYLALTKKHWGMFDVLLVESTVKNSTFHKTGLMGGFQRENYALYLKDNNNPLVLVGDTKIQGNTFLPQKRVKRGNIAGHSYYGNELIYGAVSTSKDKMPKIKNSIYLEQLSKGIIDIQNSDFIELYEGLNTVNSFRENTQIYKEQGVVKLFDINLTGNIIIVSDTLIKVNNTALLTDVILVAPNIEIMDEVVGNFQAIASENIIVGSNCDLYYPSALVLIEKEKEKNKETDKNSRIKEASLLLINSNSSIKGIVAYLSKSKTSNYKSQLYIDENSIITGEVFCDKNLELIGAVHGSVYANNFIVKQFGSVYQNHIYNGSILLNKLPQQYVGLSLENTISKVSKWLY